MWPGRCGLMARPVSGVQWEWGPSNGHLFQSWDPGLGITAKE